MKRIVVMSLFAVLLLVSCKTTKVVSEVNRDVQTVENRDLVEKQDGVKVVDVAELIETENETTTQTERSTEFESSDEMVTTETTTLYSEPDSTGKQYPTSVTVKETKLVSKDKQVSNDTQLVQDKKVTNHARDSTSAEALQTEHTDKSDFKSDSSEKINTATKTKVKMPRPIRWFFIILAVGALVFVYFILKRYKIL